MTKEQWWKKVGENLQNLKSLVVNYYPSNRQFDVEISAPGAEAACEQIRKQAPKLEDVGGVSSIRQFRIRTTQSFVVCLVLLGSECQRVIVVDQSQASGLCLTC